MTGGPDPAHSVLTPAAAAEDLIGPGSPVRSSEAAYLLDPGMRAGSGGSSSNSLRYNSPLCQVVLIGLVCFCLPGMFNALTSMGAGSQVSEATANNSLTALYASFAVFGILGGGFYNLLGPRFTLFFGCSFYVLFTGSYLYYDTHHRGDAFVIAAGALLGLGAGLLWSGQGAIMMSYPPENSKGRYISIFWIIFNFGAMLGGFLPFALNYHRSAGTVSRGTYIGFMSIMSLGTLLSLTLCTPDKVVRDDGSRVTAVRYSNVFTESWEIIKLFGNSRMLLLAPACIASNFFYTYQFNNFNAKLFTIRTRGLNNVFYWGAQMLGAALLGYVLDNCHPKRRVRGLVGLGIVGVFGMLTWAGGLAKQLQYSRESVPSPLDFKHSGSDYAALLVLYFCYGLLDAMFQTLCYWTMSTLTDNVQALSRYSGFYKGVQSAGAAAAWQVDARKTSFLTQLIINWSLLALSIPLLAVIMSGIQDSSSKTAKAGEEFINDEQQSRETV